MKPDLLWRINMVAKVAAIVLGSLLGGIAIGVLMRLALQ